MKKQECSGKSRKYRKGEEGSSKPLLKKINYQRDQWNKRENPEIDPNA